MSPTQQFFIYIFLFLNFLIFLKGLYESGVKKNAYGLTNPLAIIGIFVWGDAVIIGLFWSLSSLASLFFKNWYLFLLIISVFWLVRSLGEVIYWFNQQFSTVNRNPPEKQFWYPIFKSDSVWFAFQVIWQCLLVASVIFTIYFSHLWLNSL